MAAVVPINVIPFGPAAVPIMSIAQVATELPSYPDRFEQLLSAAAAKTESGEFLLISAFAIGKLW
ncbi:hypothetical protein [Nocardia aurantiaca]|uniref:Uncharacterized protein n=1 Tax=Nocardia aurantiaca TaxID=2675850 RepID=A0A6I3L8W3_9NOCA|nr:hypothetical protein [Nocardia aurantiaca]MTE16686.1 hypothetical protein [Nocardia aurantiaca]